MEITEFRQRLEERGFSLSQTQLDQFEHYYHTLVEWNEKMNLTAITDKEGVYLKHFYDSLTAAFYVDFTKVATVVDVGAGAGFPSIPLKIVFPELRVTIVDSLKKRIGFLEHLSETLGLKGTAFYHDRAETFAQKKEHREQYDLVLARAVARLPVLSELCLPLAKVEGTFVAMKGAGANEELTAAQGALKKLGGSVIQNEQFTLPIEESERHVIIIRKERSTPKKYPRKPGTPNKQPLS
ncbi:16S rRNA (guanine(527)-N(7))-methyltransferase RsmG [Halalkalibacterium halodurans]|uniref:16S rRNA (guanine(527)-N(7))-methyltransferase RsmG n=1 Tax=Halalkalibacterium halodurans TaxID=86665 RepID=UPI002E1A6CCD|nr:16S rRNA (guanine(527)-N(7))-methyltransferase RsmG [Halalkalibacterium halodurans]MED4081036.1 16S rRNA (guanine(527)-N(7))-methyltransferase RsmG [Halalkalibacterium halodurans]MED4084900.1 16S rRNA (guanine(527)-N(7))-methyltransferase RsmG [Halalkalibacterium halodurans]MED4103492.1 16S rRNA (guanine(527)-N(7))-methyltransferase RsmG [Halalkalibacterium halodurans]MED4107732.1 16S rRNA (guanine(527)-N(7))-methyltransferase RsmG [Halalkalibacterium halodurans]MED4123452.1 16S rRNA (guani